MLLSIIIPFYNENELSLFPLLSSINSQKGVDFSRIELILVNDGFSDYSISDDFFALFFNLNIRLVTLEKNSGPGVARQVGIDHSSAEYVMFCDCDDLIHNVGVLYSLLFEMQSFDCDFVSSSWLEEVVLDGAASFITHEFEQTWLHGKMFLRRFLVDNNIRFHPDLRVHEDTYFLKLVSALCSNRRHFNLPSYVWTFSPNSITRKDNAIYGFESMSDFVLAAISSTKELISRNSPLINEHIVQLIVYIYLITQSEEWKTIDTKPHLTKMLDSLRVNMLGLWEYWDNSSTELINAAYSTEFAKVSVRDVPRVDLFDWVEEIKGG